MPVIVPAKPVIAAKTSLFHVRSNAKCAISSAVRLKVKAMANLTPRTKCSLGCTSWVAVLSAAFRVSAFLIQSVIVVSHLLLFDAALEATFLVQQKTVQQVLRFFGANVVLDYGGYAGCPWYGHGGVVNVVQAVRVAETVLR